VSMEEPQKIFLDQVDQNRQCWKDIHIAYHLYHIDDLWFCVFLRAILRDDLNLNQTYKPIGPILDTEKHIIGCQVRPLADLKSLIGELQEPTIKLHRIESNLSLPKPVGHDKPLIGPRAFQWEFQDLDKQQANDRWGINHPGHAFCLTGQSTWDSRFPRYEDYLKEERVLYSMNPPWDGIDDVGLRIFSYPNYKSRHSYSMIHCIAPLPIILWDQFGWESGRMLGAKITVGQGIDPLKCRIALFGKGLTNTRQSFSIFSEHLDAPKTFEIQMPVNNDSLAKVVVTYGSSVVDWQNVWFPHPQKGNPCMLMLSTFDKELKAFSELIRDPDRNSIGFENAFTWLLAMNGFITTHLTGFPLHAPPDLLALSYSPPAILVIECTTTPGAAISKVHDAAKDRVSILQQLPIEAWSKIHSDWKPDPLVVSIIAAPIPESQLFGAREEAAKSGVIIIGNETIGRWFNYALTDGSSQALLQELRNARNGGLAQ